MGVEKKESVLVEGGSKTECDLVVTAEWVVPVDTDGRRADATVLRNYGVAVLEGRIIAVKSHEKLAARFEAKKVCHLPPQHVLIPGLINCHTHLGMTMLRGFADDLPLKSWLFDFIWPAEKKFISEEFVYHGTMLGMYELVKTGTTMVNDMYFMETAGMRAAKEIGMRMVCGRNVLDFKDGTIEKQCDEAEEFVKLKTKSDDLIQRGLAVHSCYTVEEPYHERLAKVSAETGAVYHVHLHETKQERIDFESTHGGDSAARVLRRCGVMSSRMVGAHCVHMDDGKVGDDEIGWMAKAGASVAHCPKSNMKLASGFCPVAKMIERGVNVCLGTDSTASNNSLDMLQEVQTAALIAKGVTRDATAVDDYTALKMATRNGARALGRLHDLGSLEVGKWADIVAIDLGQLHGLPTIDPISAIVYTTTRKVTHVWIAGKRIVAKGEVLTAQPNLEVIESYGRKLRKLKSQLLEEKENSRK